MSEAFDEPRPPQRSVQFNLDLGADSREDLVWELRHIADSIELDERDEGSVTSGGPRAGYHFDLTTDPAVTPESYKAALTDWIVQRRSRHAHRSARQSESEDAREH